MQAGKVIFKPSDNLKSAFYLHTKKKIVNQYFNDIHNAIDFGLNKIRKMDLDSYWCFSFYFVEKRFVPAAGKDVIFFVNDITFYPDKKDEDIFKFEVLDNTGGRESLSYLPTDRFDLIEERILKAFDFAKTEHVCSISPFDEWSGMYDSDRMPRV